jgi:hypothetical protein
VWLPSLPGWLLTLLLAAEAVVTVGYGVLSFVRWYGRRQRASKDRLAVLNHLLTPVQMPWYLPNRRLIGVFALLSLLSLFAYVGLTLAVFVLTTPQGWYGPPWDANTIGLFVGGEVFFAILVVTTVLLRPWYREQQRITEQIEAEKRLPW